MIIQELSSLTLSGMEDFIVFRFLPYLFIDFLVYFVLIKRYEGKRTERQDIRMIVLALVILLTVVFLSVLVDSWMFQEESGFLEMCFAKYMLFSVVRCPYLLRLICPDRIGFFMKTR